MKDIIRTRNFLPPRLGGAFAKKFLIVRFQKFSLLLQYSIILLLSYNSAFSQVNDNWQTSKSTHFIVYFKNAPQNFIDRVISQSEDYYDKIAENLGFTRYNFWLWDNRAKIYIHDDMKAYQIDTGQPGWSSGVSFAKDKIIHAFPYAKGFFDTILPHELGHIVFREFVGLDNPAVPVWLDEGVASYQEKNRYSAAETIVKAAAKNNALIPLERLFDISPRGLTDGDRVRIFYAESVSIVGYLIKEFGKDDFVVFCQYLRDRRDFVKAMRSVYPFQNIEEFASAWKKYIAKQ